MATWLSGSSLDGYGGELCQSSGIYRDDFGHCIPVQEGRNFPGSGRWSRMNDLPNAEETAGELARQRFWQAFGE